MKCASCAGELGRWHLPPHAQEARFTILTSGLLPATSDPASEAAGERNQAIRRFVEENLIVFVDLAELPPPGEGRAPGPAEDQRAAVQGVESSAQRRYNIRSNPTPIFFRQTTCNPSYGGDSIPLGA